MTWPSSCGSRSQTNGTYLLTADKLVLQQALNRLSEELNCSQCRHALVACELVLKYLLPKARPGEQRGVGLAMLTLANRIRKLGLDSDVEREVVKLLRPHRRDEKLVDP